VSVSLASLRGQFPGAVLESGGEDRADPWALVPRERVVEVLRFLRDDLDLDFDMLSDLTVVDYLAWPRGRARDQRFEVVYQLYSLKRRARLRIKARLPEADPSIDSVVPLWKGAGWLEREAWDLYGVRFRGHPDLRRILMYEEFVGHPLRKDYPIEKRQPLVRRPDPEAGPAGSAPP
jgi:NADH-quinone oxidoreductase subunit C